MSSTYPAPHSSLPFWKLGPTASSEYFLPPHPVRKKCREKSPQYAGRLLKKKAPQSSSVDGWLLENHSGVPRHFCGFPLLRLFMRIFPFHYVLQPSTLVNSSPKYSDEHPLLFPVEARSVYFHIFLGIFSRPGEEIPNRNLLSPASTHYPSRRSYATSTRKLAARNPEIQSQMLLKSDEANSGFKTLLFPFSPVALWRQYFWRSTAATPGNTETRKFVARPSELLTTSSGNSLRDTRKLLAAIGEIHCGPIWYRG